VSIHNTLFRIVLLVALLLPPGAAAQHVMPMGDDTMRVQFTDPVIVTASRIPYLLETAPVAVDVLHGDELQRMPARTVADALAAVAGTGVRMYGALGSLSTVSMRGLGPEYTIVLVNGVRINDAQNGLVDLGRFALQQVERIEVVHGGHAAMYGTDALGGVVNIRTDAARARTGLRVAGGSFGYRLAELEGGIRGASGAVQLSAGYEEADNDFPLIGPKVFDLALVRRNAGYQRRRVGADGLLTFSNATLHATAMYAASNAGMPGALTSRTQAEARQIDNEGMAAFALRMQLSPRMALSVAPSLRMGAQRYVDPMTRMDSRYDNASASLPITFELTPAAGVRVHPGVEVGYARLVSDEVRATPERRTIALFLATELQPWTPLRIYPTLRAEQLRDIPGPHERTVFTPSLGMHVTVAEHWLSLRAQVARGFRAPTFNQLYWREGGNSELRPEDAWVLDAGVRWTPEGPFRFIDLTVFHHDITDKIVWMPGSGMWWRPRNIQHVVSKGFELSVAGGVAADDGIAWRVAMQYVDARKMNEAFAGDRTAGRRLVYVPGLSGMLSLDVPLADWLRASLRQQLVGSRYSTEDNDVRSMLPAYALTDLAVAGRLHLAGTDSELKLELLNLFDASYEVVANFPMPGRSLRATLSTFLAPSDTRTP
jgi:iron complex outermembrane receptor protein